MAAMNRVTGELIEDEVEEVTQSVAEILDTPRGHRVMRAEYGTDLPQLVDVGMNGSGRARVALATSEAVNRHEPRVRLTNVVFTANDRGELEVEADGTVIVSAAPIQVRRG